MIDALIAGRLSGKAQQRTGQSGRPFVTASIRAAAGNGESLFAAVIAFDERPRTALLALDDGDAVSVAGSLTPKIFHPRNGGEPRVSLDVVAHAVTTTYHVQRKRKAVGSGAGQTGTDCDSGEQG